MGGNINTLYIDKISDPYCSKKSGYLSRRQLSAKNYKEVCFYPYERLGHGTYLGGLLGQNLLYLDKKIQSNEIKCPLPVNITAPKKIDSRKVVYLGCFLHHWGHFLVEGIARAYYILSDPNAVYVYSTSDGKAFSKQFLEFFELLGLQKENLVHVSRPTIFREIIVPDICVAAGRFYTKEYTAMFDIIKSKVPPVYNDKLYLCYVDKGICKKYYGLESIDEFFRINGYRFVNLEKFSLKTQIGLIKGCKHFACINGTLMHNMLFADADTEIIIINKTYLQNEYQPLIDFAQKLNVTYVDSFLALLPITIGYGPFCLYISDSLKKFAHSRNFKIPTNAAQFGVLPYLFAWQKINSDRSVLDDVLRSKSMTELWADYNLKANKTLI